MICSRLVWLHRSTVLNRSLLANILRTCKSRDFNGTRSCSLSHTNSSPKTPSELVEKNPLEQKKEMIPLQAPGAGRGTPNHHLSPNAPSFTPTSRGRGGGRGFRRRDMPQTDAPMIAELSRETLHHMFTAEETKITDFEHLASYNWLDERNPTIAVPGNGSSIVELELD